MKKFYLFACIAIATAGLTLFSGCKEEEQKPLPADAGAISGTAENACPAKTVDLSIKSVADATTYVWYRNGEPISDATTASYTATLSGSYTVAGKNTEGEGKQSPVHAVTIVACPGEDGAVPEAAGAITAPATNVCPSREVTLTVAPITGATSYSWAIAYAADDIDSTVTAEPELVFDLSSFLVDQALTFTVSGVNAAGYGEASAPKVVTRVSCLPAKPVITGNADWIIETGQHGDTVVYQTACPVTTMPGTATCATENVTYKWYWQVVAGGAPDPELIAWPTDGSAVMSLGGGRGYTYNYAVVAVNNDGESERSNVIQVIIPACNQPNRPQGNGIGLWPDKTGEYSFYPQDGQPKNFGISNCDVQNKTFKSETSVELVCNGSSGNLGEQLPVTGYAFWVKTTESGSFTKVLTASTVVADRKIVVDGTTYPSGTYQVTAVNQHGDSEFGPNWIAVDIRNDCGDPPPVTLDAGTVSVAAGATITDNGVVSNVCPKEYFDINLTPPSTPVSSSNVTYIWTRTAPNPEVIQSGTQNGLWDVTPALNGTYSVTYSKTVLGNPYTSEPTTFTIATTLCAPTFTKKPSAIVDKENDADEYAEAVLTAPNNDYIRPLISGYEWFFGDRLALDTEVSTIGVASTLTFRLLKEGTYKVRAKSTYGDSPFSEEITLTKKSPPAAYTRADLIGSYSVADWKGNLGGTAANYTLTIAAGTESNAIIITGLGGNKGSTSAPWYTTLNATVSFTADGLTTGNYGTVTIPLQTYPGTVAGTATHYFKHGANFGNPPTCNTTDAVTFTIKFVEGNAGVVGVGLPSRYATKSADACNAVNDFYGHETKEAIWTKQ
jgi:hypothetical protein